MRLSITTITLLALAAPCILACDSPDDEAELLALDIEEDNDQIPDPAQAAENHKPNVEEFDLEANMTPAAGPPGKCCKALCSWDPTHWHQLPGQYQHPDNCNYWAAWWCQYGGYGPGPGLSHLEDAQWRTCG